MIFPGADFLMDPQIVLLAFSGKECNICLALVVVESPHPTLEVQRAAALTASASSPQQPHAQPSWSQDLYRSSSQKESLS